MKDSVLREVESGRVDILDLAELKDMSFKLVHAGTVLIFTLMLQEYFGSIMNKVVFGKSEHVLYKACRERQGVAGPSRLLSFPSVPRTCPGHATACPLLSPTWRKPGLCHSESKSCACFLTCLPDAWPQ